MALKQADRVRETSTTTGTGAMALAGAPSGYRTFSSVLSDGDTCTYAIALDADWEVGVGTYNSSGNTLTRTTVTASSNAGAAVNWGAGSKSVFISPLASDPAFSQVIRASGGINASDILLSGVLTASAGLASAPAISTSGYANTGVFFPPGTVAVGTDGEERIRVSSSGDIILGNGPTSSTPNSTNISATNGDGTNVAGANISITAGRPTGSGTGGAIIFSAAAPGSSGTALRTAFERGRFNSSGLILGRGDQTGSPALGVLSGASGSGTNVGGASIQISAGAGTGSGASGEIQLRTSPPGASGSTAQAYQNVLVCKPSGEISVAQRLNAKRLSISGQAVTTPPRWYGSNASNGGAVGNIEDNTWNSIVYAREIGWAVGVCSTGAGIRVRRAHVSSISTGFGAATPEDNAWNHVCWSGSLLVAVASTGTNRVMTSPNSSTWTARAAAAPNEWRSVCWSPELGLFVAVSSTGTGDRVMTSTSNGVTWTSRTSAADNAWQSVCWSPERRLFVAVANSGTSNRVMTSSDGTTWTTRSTSGIDSDYRCVCWSDELGLFIAVGDRIISSPDGITWTSRQTSLAEVQTCVIWAPEKAAFFSIGSATNSDSTAGYVSYDGVTWTRDFNGLATQRPAAVCYVPEIDTLVTVGRSGTGIRWQLYSSGFNSQWGKPAFPTISTTASAANAFLDSSNQNALARSTSSLRYKTDVENIDQVKSDAIMSVRPVWYRSLASADRKDWSWYGLIAEEVAEIEPRLVHFTTDPSDPTKMVPDGVQYDRLAVLLIDVVKRLKQRVEDLEARLGLLEGK